MTSRILAPLNPDEHALAPLFRLNIDDAMLREIAEADYGWNAEHGYALLAAMWKSGDVAADDGDLIEVLELIRWSEPDDPAWSPGGHGSRGHWMRLFACAALARFAPMHRERFDGECATVAQLISSAIELGPAVARAAASVLAWRFLEYPGESEDAAFLAFGILLLATHLASREERGSWLREIAAWVEEEEARARAGISRTGLPNWDEWLLGLTFFDLRHRVWRELARTILARPPRPHPPEAAEALQLLGELVAGI